jgi:hypothetical protein
MNMLKLHPSILVAAALLSAVPVSAKDTDVRREKQMQIETRLRDAVARALRRDVGLDEQKAVQIEKTLQQFAPERQRLRLELSAARGQVKALLKQDSDDQKSYQAALARFRDAQKKLRALREREFDAISKQLNPKQQAKLVESLRKLHHKLGRALREETAKNEQPER